MPKLVQLKDKNNDPVYPITQEIVLFNDDNGVNTNITLSRSAADFKYIEIFYRNNDNWYSSSKIYKPDGKIVSVVCNYTNSNYVYIKTLQLRINGTLLTYGTYSEGRIGNNIPTVFGVSQSMMITRVVGYL